MSINYPPNRSASLQWTIETANQKLMPLREGIDKLTEDEISERIKNATDEQRSAFKFLLLQEVIKEAIASDNAKKENPFGITDNLPSNTTKRVNSLSQELISPDIPAIPNGALDTSANIGTSQLRVFNGTSDSDDADAA